MLVGMKPRLFRPCLLNSQFRTSVRFLYLEAKQLEFGPFCFPNKDVLFRSLTSSLTALHGICIYLSAKDESLLNLLKMT